MVGFFGIISLCRLINAKFIFIEKSVLFQKIQFRVSSVSMSKTVQFHTIQFSKSTQFSSIWPVDRTLSGATTLGQSGPGSDSNEEVLRISQSSIITGTSPSDSLELYYEHSLVGVLFLCRGTIGVFYNASRLQNTHH